MKRLAIIGFSTLCSAVFPSLGWSQFQQQIGQAGSPFGGSAFGGGGINPTSVGGTNRSQNRPGAFGGPGITGVPVIDFSTINAGTAFSSGQNSLGGLGGGIGGLGSAGGLGGGQVSGGIGGANFGSSPFGPNAFGGQTGGFGQSALGGGLGGIGGIGGLGGLGGVGGLGGIGGLGGLGGLNSRNRGLSGNNSNARGGRNQIRTTVSPDIELGQSRKTELAATFQTRMSKLPFPDRLRGVNVGINSGVVRLTGSVASMADKKLAERIVLLEPGVDSVVNDLTVVQKPAEQIQAMPNR